VNLNNSPSLGALTAADFPPRVPPGCTGPCDQGRTLCPSPAACQIADDGKGLTWADLWLDTPEGVRIGLGIVAGIVGAVLALHWWLA